MSILIKRWSTRSSVPEVEAFLARTAFPPEAEEAARAVLADIRTRGEQAVLDAARRFDGADLEASELRIRQDELDAAGRAVDLFSGAFQLAANGLAGLGDIALRAPESPALRVRETLERLGGRLGARAIVGLQRLETLDERRQRH